MDITSPLFLAILANGPVKADGYTYFLYGGKVRKCKSTRGPRKSRTEGEKQTTDRFTEARKMWKIYKRAIGGLTNMANRGPGERGFQERLFIPFNQRGMPTPGQRSMGIQNFPFFHGNTRSPRHHRHGTQRVDGHLELGKRY